MTKGLNLPKRRSASSSPLLSLAPELRNKIYRLVLTSKEPLLVARTTISTHKALLDTCAKVRNEARSIFWAENTFHVVIDGNDVTPIIAWINSLESNARLITRIFLDIALSPEAHKVLAEAANKRPFGFEFLYTEGLEIAHRQGEQHGRQVAEAFESMLHVHGGPHWNPISVSDFRRKLTWSDVYCHQVFNAIFGQRSSRGGDVVA